MKRNIDDAILDFMERTAQRALQLNRLSMDVGVSDALALIAEIRDLQAQIAALQDMMTWLGKGKMRPFEKSYQAFLQHDAEYGFDDTPLDYVEWLERELTWREELATRATGTAKKPDAAPAPVENAGAVEIAVGDRVWFGGREATVHKAPEDETGEYVIMLYGMDATHYHTVLRSEIRPRQF